MAEENINEQLPKVETFEPTEPIQEPGEEGGIEQTTEQSAVEKTEKPLPKIENPIEIKPAAVKVPTPIVKTEEQLKVEGVLSEGLEDLFATLPPARQAEFKEKGEQTASKIAVLLKKAKINIKKIVSLIRDWLKMIPGVNKFFLEQEAKIKADKIISLK